MILIINLKQMIMKKIVLVLLFCVATLVNSYSQTKQESIKELFHLMQLDSLMDKTFASMNSSIMMQPLVMDSAFRARSMEIMNSAMPVMKEISKKMINEDMVLVYDKYFSQDEINDLIAFHKTPTGQKFIKVTPDIQKDIRKVMMEKYMPEIQKIMKTKYEEMKNTEKK